MPPFGACARRGEGRAVLRKVVVFLDVCVDRLILLAAMIALIVCSYATFDAVMVYYQANDTGILKYKPELAGDAGSMAELSPDVVAWLTLDGTKIDYSVMQGENNSEYINKDPYGDFSLAGSIFLDSRNSADFSDSYCLLYGHHMEYGTMFGALDEYLSKDYLDNHRTGMLTTVQGQTYDISIFASVQAPSTQSEVFGLDTTTNDKVLSYVKGHANVLEPGEVAATSKVIAFSTCTSADNLDRVIVFGTLSPIDKDASVTEEVLA